MRLAPHGLCALLIVGVIVGCPGGSSDEKSGDVDKPAGKSGSSKSKSKPSEVPTIVTSEVVRLSGARAILRLPELPEGWTIVHKQSAMLTGVQLYRGDPKNFTGFVTLAFESSVSDKPEAFHAEFAESMRLAPLVASGPAATFEIEGGLANTWSGTNEYGVAERGWIAVIIQDGEAVKVFARGADSVFDSEVLPMAKNLLTGLRLGTKVPKLADNNPSERLEGLWEYKRGLETDWIAFDPRGYAHTSTPDDPTALEFDIRHALGERLFKYEIAGGKIVLERFPPDAEDVVRNWSFTHQGEALMISGGEYRRVDDAKVDLKPGKWEFYESFDTGNAYTGSSGIATDEATYVFSPDGTYTYSGGFSYSHTEMDVGSPGNIDWSAAGHAAPEPAKGKWKLDGNTLVLDDEKIVAKRTIYASKHSSGKIVYIAGRMFVNKD